MKDSIIKNKKGKDRLQYELEQLMNDPDINNCFGVDYWDPDSPNPDVFHWQITLIPPQGTDYEGGFFKIEAKFPENYPDIAPTLKFITRIFHCNVGYNDGHICLNSLKDSWKRSFSMENVLNHIMILLYKQNSFSPMNDDAAKLIKNDNNKFKEKVKEEIKKYANINDYEDLKKQNIKLIKDCQCYWCKSIFNSLD